MCKTVTGRLVLGLAILMRIGLGAVIFSVSCVLNHMVIGYAYLRLGYLISCHFSLLEQVLLVTVVTASLYLIAETLANHCITVL